MRILVIARDRKLAEDVAQRRFPRDTTEPGTRERWWDEDGNVVETAIIAQDLRGRQYDRIVVCQQKHITPAQSDYLAFRLFAGGSFERDE